MGQIFEELKRRNIFRVAIAYLVSAWLVLQVADLVLDGIGAPDWVMKALLLFGALGFPPVLIFSWAYELTPEGIRKETEVDRSRSVTRETARKLDIATISMLVAVVGVVIVERNFLHDEHVEGPVAAASTAPEKSIAVLAFDDLSPDGDHVYFAEGLSEELLNVLAQVGDLQVAGRTSSFAFKGQKKDLREIGELLNVAHILEGSVRRAGNRIRVTAQLIKASDGYHLFSETYDRELEDVFAVQDEIAQEISNALLSEIVGTEAVTATRTDTEAYELYLLARQRIHTRDILAMREADAMLARAIEIDPAYAPALAQKALVTYLMSDSLGSYGDAPIAEAMPAARRLVDKALAIDEKLAEAHAISGLLFDAGGNPEAAVASLKHALSLNRRMSDAANWLANAFGALTRPQDAREILEDVVGRDPTFGPAFTNLAAEYVRTGEFDRAEALIDRVARIVGENAVVSRTRGIVYTMRGATAAAIRAFEPALDENPYATIPQMWAGFALRGVADYETLSRIGLPEHRMLAYSALGDTEAALEILDNLDLDAAFVPRVLGEIGWFLNDNGMSREYIEYVLAEYGSIDEVLRQVPVGEVWGLGYLPELAYAHLATGDEERFNRLRGLAGEELESDRARGMNNWLIHMSAAEYAALQGDLDGTAAALERALAAGFRDARGLERAIFRGLHGEPRFEALRQKMADLVDAQRAELGMPPYRPLANTDDERPVYVH